MIQVNTKWINLPVATPKHHQSQKGADNSHLMWLILHGVGLRSVYTTKEVVWISKDRMKLRRLISFKWHHLIASIIISTHAHTPAYTNTSRTHTYTHTHSHPHTHIHVHIQTLHTHITHTHVKNTHMYNTFLSQRLRRCHIFSQQLLMVPVVKETNCKTICRSVKFRVT